MKLIHQQSLVLKGDDYHHLYEIDLCEVGRDRYVVNFRQLLNNQLVKEGQETILAVSYESAVKVFENCINYRLAKAYQLVDLAENSRDLGHEDEVVASPDESNDLIGTEEIAEPIAVEEDPLELMAIDQEFSQEDDDYLVQHLKAISENAINPYEATISLERLVWRAGELRLKKLTPYLIAIAQNSFSSSTQLSDNKVINPNILDYSLVWSLGRSKETEALSILRRYQHKNYNASIRQIASEGIRQLSTGAQRKQFIKETLEQLPFEIKESLQTNNTDLLAEAIFNYFQKSHATYDVLNTLYLLTDEYTAVKQVLISIIQDHPLELGFFKNFRRLFKAAEFRDDSETLGWIAYRIAKSPHNFYYNRAHRGVFIKGRWVNIREELKSPYTKLTYSFWTRRYIQKRIWRYLRKLAQQNSRTYVQMAVGILLPYVDADAQNIKKGKKGKEAIYGPYAPYWVLNHILYSNSPRYELVKSRRAWTYKIGQPINAKTPQEREEAFPHLWDAAPEGLLHLLAESKCEIVQEFAVKALMANSGIHHRISIGFIQLLLQSPYEANQSFGLHLVEGRIQRDAVNRTLILSLLKHPKAAIRKIGLDWLDIKENKDWWLKATDFIAQLLAMEEDVSQYAQAILPTLANQLQKEVVQHSLGQMAAYPTEIDDIQQIQLNRSYKSLVQVYPKILSNLDLSSIQALFQHPALPIQQIGANLLNLSKINLRDVNDEILISLLNSPIETNRNFAIKAINEQETNDIFKNKTLIYEIFVSAFDNVQAFAKDLINRVAEDDEALLHSLLNTLVQKLLDTKADHAQHAFIINQLTNFPKQVLSVIDSQLLWQLFQTSSPSAQEFASYLMRNSQLAHDLSIRQLAQLGNHPYQAVRNVVGEVFESDIPRVKESINDALGLFSSEWEDMRFFAINFFLQFNIQDWEAEQLIFICDHSTEDVQQFGKDLLGQFFDDEFGSIYLEKLHEHPSPNIQAYLTNYLEKYASGEPKKLLALMPYFKSIFYGGEANRSTKNSIFNYLSAEAVKTPSAANIISEFLQEISLSVIEKDKTASIAIMQKIAQQFPKTKMPLELVPYEVRDKK